MLLRDLQVAINSLAVLALLLPNLTTVEDLLAGLGLDATTSRVVVIDLVDQVRGVLLSHSQSLSVHLCFLIHADRFLRFLRSQVALLRLGEVILLLVRLGLLELDTGDAFWVVLAGNLDGRVPVSLVLVHVDGFLWLVSFNELLLGLFEPVIVLKV